MQSTSTADESHSVGWKLYIFFTGFSLPFFPIDKNFLQAKKSHLSFFKCVYNNSRKSHIDKSLFFLRYLYFGTFIFHVKKTEIFILISWGLGDLKYIKMPPWSLSCSFWRTEVLCCIKDKFTTVSHVFSLQNPLRTAGLMFKCHNTGSVSMLNITATIHLFLSWATSILSITLTHFCKIHHNIVLSSTKFHMFFHTVSLVTLLLGLLTNCVVNVIWRFYTSSTTVFQLSVSWANSVQSIILSPISSRSIWTLSSHLHASCIL